jgi:hypothetical protein
MDITIEETSMLQLEKAADERGDTPASLVEQIIRRFLREEAADKDAGRKMTREIEAFTAMHPKLWEQYPHAYVAIYQGNVVDHDTDQLELYKRIEEAYPYEVVLIRQVLPDVEKVYHFRSPKAELTPLAHQEDKAVDDLVCEVMQRYIWEAREQQLDQELAAYRALHADLKPQYLDQYVAIRQGEVVGHGPERKLLSRAMRRRYGAAAVVADDVVLIMPVTESPEREWQFRSPRLERAVGAKEGDV